MTYYEAYSQLPTIDEIKRQAVIDTEAELTRGGNPDRLKAINDAAARVIEERLEMAEHES